MLPRRVINFCMLVLLLPLVLSSAAMAQKATGPEPTSEKTAKVKFMVTGKLVKETAGGSGTTGWAVDLDEPQMIEGKMLTRIACDPAGKKPADRGGALPESGSPNATQNGPDAGSGARFRTVGFDGSA